MKNLIYTLLLASLLTQSAIVAGEPLQMQTQMPKAPTTFAIAGILRSNADGVVIKLIQGVHRAGSRDEAVGAFTQEVLARYPGYSLVDTLVTSLPSQKAACGISI
jgi:hypothetical protein